ncbi:addiction module protein [Arcobacter aquimarinus]|uniref:Toxin-antitoxin system antitoxin component n=1 Tax=Arcobacter aquimarinus TaxID=1315211 RepID=A0AAE7E0P6_9BACT|nr:addiction module protein [Arcobacter aquimarinus]MCB9097600.1 addiction module protein [Arcobacter sp.]QKE25795.1 putative toxin-antitoxin system antitoxin component [Arcobacter aquimarinus]RXI35224.1 addiction module protein [Arcobacter aquimarinus]
MGTNEIIKEAINLKPQEKYLIIESLILSLNEPNKEIEKLWIEESEKRLEEYKNGNLETLSLEEVFN